MTLVATTPNLTALSRIFGGGRGNVWQDMLLFIFEGITGKRAEDGLFNSHEY